MRDSVIAHVYVVVPSWPCVAEGSLRRKGKSGRFGRFARKELLLVAEPALRADRLA